MRSLWISALAVVLLAVGALTFSPDLLRGDTAQEKEKQQQTQKPKPRNTSPSMAVKNAVKWLVSVQGNDGGWGQDGGETSYVRNGERLETTGNDVANTAVATLALVRAGHTPTQGKHRRTVQRAVDFILRHVEQSPPETLAVTSIRGTQIQRKLGPYIDTFLTSMLLAELDGQMASNESNVRVRRALQRCVNKIEDNQQGDGSWNISGGWAPILGTSIASRSLFMAETKGVEVEPTVLAKVNDYTKQSAKAGGAGSGGGIGTGSGTGVGPGSGGGVGGGVFRAGPADAASAGVPLYKSAQVLEQLSRTEEDREKNADEIAAVTKELADARFVRGFGSMGGEEFFSYLNISDSLHRTGGKEWQEWNGKIKSQLVRLQNEDGTWAGHHCITGRVAVTSAAILTLLVEKQPVMQPTSNSSGD